MDLHILNTTLIASISLKLIIAFLLLINLANTCQFSEAANVGNYIDKLALLDFKSHLTNNPDAELSSWNDSVHFCLWKGVECGHRHQSRVIGLHLKGMNLYGNLSPYIGNLSFLKSLDLSLNSFTGVIPPELGLLTRLQNLNLKFNFLEGAIPENISSCSNLIAVSLSNNFLTQQIPWKLGTLLKLQALYLGRNNLTGHFPASFGNLSSLEVINVSDNNMEGGIPETIGGLKNLTSLTVSGNKFSGVFPPAIYNLSSLKDLALTSNKFHGDLRRDIGLVFPNIHFLALADNSFTGKLSVSLSNLSTLLVLELGLNRFTGNVPPSLGHLKNLTCLGLHNNSLGDDLLFLDSLTNCSSLQVLKFGMNNFGGKLTASVANLSSQLQWFDMSINRISGSIPEEIASLVGLTTLSMGLNLFTGSIPTSIATLQNLRNLFLFDNHLTGEIPSSLGNLTQLLQLYLFNNNLEGRLPSTFSNLKLLQRASFSQNKLSGTIPQDFISLSSLTIVLDLSYNSFTGPLPAVVGNLTFLTSLDVSHNNLSGEIPTKLGLCLSLIELFIGNNVFQGSIPDLSQLRGLQYLDLSNNNLSGQIPKYFTNFTSLMNLNLSNNNFEGEVPTEGVFNNESAIQIYGNIDLCGGITQLDLQPCSHVMKKGRSKRHVNLKLILPIVIVSPCLLLLLFCILFLRRRNLSRRKHNLKPSFGHAYPKITFKELYDSTEGFSSTNLIGAGSFGAVYKGILEQGELPFAIKVLNLHRHGASKSFVAECEALRNICHRNLIKILTVCSGTDYKGNDFKAFVFPYMSNGSLDKWLHPEDDQLSHDRNLSLLQRINIAIDIASALEYLHHQCHQSPVIHCDLKPSNVLLDSDLTAHVSDFGLARIISKYRGEGDLNQFSSLGIKGTVGYIAPEYGTGSPVSTLGDIYSYGILLLELFTERRPVDEKFQDNFNLHNFVKQALLDEAVRIIDQSALNDQEIKDALQRDLMNKEKMIDCLVCVLQIGISCSSEDSQDRIDMSQVVHSLVSAKEKFMGLVKMRGQ